jgi:FkbM family methyltransferase
MWYAQRGEDKKLREYFPDKHHGFYIDVGAWDPTLDSVTKHFYDDGWHGVNIEPVPYYWERLVAERQRDTNLNLAVGDFIGNRMFNYIHGTGLSTFHEGHAESGSRGRQREMIHTTVITLNRVFEHYVPANQFVDFLKIDVEGYEGEVLLGLDLSKHRPGVMCIEATAPNSDTPAWDTWDHILIEAGYHFDEFDGLNRWYHDLQLTGAGATF